MSSISSSVSPIVFLLWLLEKAGAGRTAQLIGELVVVGLILYAAVDRFVANPRVLSPGGNARRQCLTARNRHVARIDPWM
jgi:hypothetical protein